MLINTLRFYFQANCLKNENNDIFLSQSCLTKQNAEDWCKFKVPNRYQQLSIIAFAICVSIRYGTIDYRRQRYSYFYNLAPPFVRYEKSGL